jgi:hypothetical protein
LCCSELSCADFGAAAAAELVLRCADFGVMLGCAAAELMLLLIWS